MTNPLDLFLWTFRRNERDVIRMYDYLSGVMRLSTGGDMLNFGMWEEQDTPLMAQERLCRLVGSMARLEPGQIVADVGSGYGAPAAIWKSAHSPAGVVCINTNLGQLRESAAGLWPANASATLLPLRDCSVDRVVAFESAQHFKPLEEFASESYRVLRPGGILMVAIPVVADMRTSSARLGLLSVTWSSEHYTAAHVESVLAERFESLERRYVGPMVYEPLADYYGAHREQIRQQVERRYPGYVGRILEMSIKKMKAASQGGVIDYLLAACQKRQTGKEIKRRPSPRV